MSATAEDTPGTETMNAATASTLHVALLPKMAETTMDGRPSSHVSVSPLTSTSDPKDKEQWRRIHAYR